jgi:heptosyltransferase II
VNDFRRILVFQTAYLGDAVLSVPLLRSLKSKFPGAQIAFVCRKGVGALFTSSGVADVVIEVDKSDKSSLKNAFSETKNFKADLIISAHRSFRTALWVWRLRAPVRLGFRDSWSFFAYTKRVKRPDRTHDVLRQLSLLEALGEKIPAPENLIDWMRLSEESEFSLKIQFPPNSKFEGDQGAVVIAPGSQWNTKRWTLSGYSELARRFLAENRRVVLAGTADEKALCDEIVRAAPGAMNMAGQTSILELAQLLQRASLLVCNDSGTMHVAVAAGTPVLSIFGATVPSQGYSPWSARSRIVDVELSCRPCGAHGHRECPLGTHDCMKKVTSEVVARSAKELLNQKEALP